MQTDGFMDTRKGKHPKIRRSWYILALALFVLSLLMQQPLLLLAVLFTLVIGLVPDLWYRSALRHLTVYQEVNEHHLFFGEEVKLSMSIENQKLLPLPWLRVETTLAPPLTILTQHATKREKIGQIATTWLLGSFQRVTRQYRMYCQARGCYIFGPVKLRSRDPLGWRESELVVLERETILVYPLIASLEALGLSFLHPFGEQRTTRRMLEDPLRVAGVRDYQLGDDPRRIHWKATAHAGALRSKIYEYSGLRRILLLLDAWNHSRAWAGSDLEIQELCITVAASLAVWALDEGYLVGLLTNSAVMTAPGEHAPIGQTGSQDDTEGREKLKTTMISPAGVRVPFACDPGQYERLLSLLARLAPGSSVPLENIIDAEEMLFPPMTTVILISASTTLNEATIERLVDLRAYGSALHLVLVGEREGKGWPETYDIPVHYPGGREKWYELVRAAANEKGAVLATSSTSFQLE
jgi:uncharacterized protein (DUF58 family)